MTATKKSKANTMAVARFHAQVRRANREMRLPPALNYRLHRAMHPRAIGDVRPGFRNWRWGKRIR